MQQKSISFLGKKIYYYTSGSGEKTLVLLHGFLESSSMWEDYSKRWGNKYRIICIDIPGHGKSEVIAEVHTVNLMADAVDAVLKKEEVKKVCFIGHSMGGYISLAFGERYAEKISGVILLNSTAHPDSEIKKADRDRAVKVMQKNAAIFINEAIPNLFADSNREKFKNAIDRIIQEALQIPVEGACAALRGMKVREDKTHLLKENKFPVHFVSGAKDNVIPIEKVQEQVSLNENIRSVVFPESGHMSFLEAKEECFIILNQFIEDII